MEDNDHPPANWGDYRLCNLCRVLQAPRALDGGCCSNKEWCAEVRASRGTPDEAKREKDIVAIEQ